MNKTKRAFQLAAAITTMVFSSILLIGAIIIIAELSSYAGSYDVNEFIVAYVFVILFAVANITISAIMCCPPKKGTHKGLCIATLVLNAVLALLYILAQSAWCIVPLICVGLFIAELCIKNTAPQVAPNVMTNSNVMPATPIQPAVAPSPVETPVATPVETPVEQKPVTVEGPKSSVDEKIERIKKLNADGIISNEEMKELILEELKK